MRLQATRQQRLIHDEPNDLVIGWSIDVKAAASEQSDEPEFTVGRILADELRRLEIEQLGYRVWDVADADSSGLEAAWASVLNDQGEFRGNEFEGIGDPVVYLYRFALHPDFGEWRMAVMDAACRIFESDALILAQHHTTWLSQEEFSLLGFEALPPTVYQAPPGYVNIDRLARFMVRENTLVTDYSPDDYPKDSPFGERRHAKWLESQGKWTDLI